MAMPPQLRRVLGTLHLWIGLTLCLPLAVLGLTGSILVFEPELTAWLDPPPRATTPRATALRPARPIAELVAAAASAAAPGYAPAFFIPPAGEGDAAVVRLAERGRPGPGGVQVFLDPPTGA